GPVPEPVPVLVLAGAEQVLDGLVDAVLVTVAVPHLVTGTVHRLGGGPVAAGGGGVVVGARHRHERQSGHGEDPEGCSHAPHGPSSRSRREAMHRARPLTHRSPSTPTVRSGDRTGVGP